jgi:alkaline phosphatase
MVEAALLRLGSSDAGFVALMEVEGTDVVGHANDPLASVVAEMLEFDRGVAVGLEFARANPATLVIVTADHETGGLGLFNQDGQLAARYLSTGHSGAMVPLFAAGPQSERFRGIRGNDEIGRLLLEITRGAR